MNKIIKTFFLFNLILFSSSLKANCVGWKEELLGNQGPQYIGAGFPVVKYKAWANHEVGVTLEDKSTTCNGIAKAIFIVVPGAFTPTCTNKHVKPFVEAYNNEESYFRKNSIPTHIIARNDPDVMATWAKHLGAKNNLLHFIPDPDYELLSRLGLVEDNGRLGPIGKRSIIYVEDGRFISLQTEETNAEVSITSVQSAEKFWEENSRKATQPILQ